MDNTKSNSNDNKKFVVNNDIEDVLSGASAENNNNKFTIKQAMKIQIKQLI